MSKNPAKARLGFYRIDPRAKAPIRATDGSACWDLSALESATVLPGLTTVIHTGLCFQIPDGYVLQAYSRSGHGFRRGVRLCNSVGIIDADYTGEVLVGLHNDGRMPFDIAAGDRILQVMLMRLPDVELAELDVISKRTDRGCDGLGSTGS